MVTALALLRAIADAPSDDANRLVFADWLEEAGDWRAEFVLRRSPGGEEPPADAVARWRELRVRMPAGWLTVLGREPIEGCGVGFNFRCPLRWDGLTATKVASERYCVHCRETVYRCDTIEEAREHAVVGHCIAVDAGLARAPGDLKDIDEGDMVLGITDTGF